MRCIGKETSKWNIQLPQMLSFADVELLWVSQFFLCSVTNFLSFKIFLKRHVGQENVDQTFKFSRPYNRIQPEKLTNHSACTN